MKQSVRAKFVLALAFAGVAGTGLAGSSARGAETTVPSPGPAAASTTNVLTLDLALHLALANNPELRAAGAQVAAVAGRADLAGRWSNPELELSAEDVPPDGGGLSQSKNLIGLTQTVPFPGKKKSEREAGRQAVRLSEAELAQRRAEVVRDVKIAFGRALAAEGAVNVAAELAQVAESSANSAQKRFAAGDVALQEQLRAEVQLEQARNGVQDAQRERAVAQQELITRLGRPDLAEAAISGALNELPDPAVLNGGPEDWLARHPGVKAARAKLDQVTAERRRATLEPYPDIKLGIAGGRDAAAEASIMEFRVGLPLPLFDRSKGRNQEAQANVSLAESELAAAEQRLLGEWHAASRRYRTAAEQAARYRERILPKANEALRLVQTGFEQGKFGFMDLLDTQRTTAEARLAYQQKLLEMNSARAELEALLQPQTNPTSTTK